MAVHVTSPGLCPAPCVSPDPALWRSERSEKHPLRSEPLRSLFWVARHCAEASQCSTRESANEMRGD